jgi:hypothetical protein
MPSYRVSVETSLPETVSEDFHRGEPELVTEPHPYEASVIEEGGTTFSGLAYCSLFAGEVRFRLGRTFSLKC